MPTIEMCVVLIGIAFQCRIEIVEGALQRALAQEDRTTIVERDSKVGTQLECAVEILHRVVVVALQAIDPAAADERPGSIGVGIERRVKGNDGLVVVALLRQAITTKPVGVRFRLSSDLAVGDHPLTGGQPGWCLGFSVAAGVRIARRKRRNGDGKHGDRKRQTP